MSGNLTRGDRAIVYLGNLNMGAAEELLAALRDQGIEVVAKLKAGREPAGPPLIVAVIQDPDDPRCPMCGWPDDDAVTIEGRTVDQVIFDEAPRAYRAEELPS